MLEISESGIAKTRRMIREVFSREGRQAYREAFRIAWPLALRRARRHKLRTALFALSVTLACIVFLLFAAFRDATTGSMSLRVEPLELPGGLLIMADSLGPEALKAIDWMPQIRSHEQAVWLEALTQAGEMPVIGLVPAGKTMARFGEVVTGRMPVALGEVALPRALPGGYGPGSSFGIRYIRADGTEATAWLSVCGTYEPVSRFVSSAVIVLEQAREIGQIQANAVFAWLSDTAHLEDAVRRVSSDVPGAITYTYLTPQKHMASLIKGVLSPANFALLLAFGLCALCILNLQLISFLERKRQIGVLRALGMDSRETGVLLLLEGLVPLVTGALAGVAFAHLIALRVSPYLPYSLVISPGASVSTVAYALLSFIVATWLPVTLSSRATVDQLLHNRRVYLKPNLSCAHCGRCGGF